MAENWPDSTAVEEYLTALGITVPAGFDFDVEIEAVVAEVETLTGWSPFKQSETSSTQIIDPPLTYTGGPMKPNNGVILPLPSGLMTCDSVITASRTLVLGTDYWLEPSAKKPWERIRVSFPFWSKPQTVSVTGKWGFSATIPADLYKAVRDIAAYRSMASFQSTTLMSGLGSFTEGDVKESYTSDLVLETLGNKTAEFEAICLRYKRVSVGL